MQYNASFPEKGLPLCFEFPVLWGADFGGFPSSGVQTLTRYVVCTPESGKPSKSAPQSKGNSGPSLHPRGGEPGLFTKSAPQREEN